MFRVTGFRPTDRFKKELKSAPIDCQKAAKDVLNSLQKQPIPTILRLHNLKGYSKPTIWKIDIYANKSWQITFEMDGETAILRRLATHKEIDRKPR